MKLKTLLIASIFPVIALYLLIGCKKKSDVGPEVKLQPALVANSARVEIRTLPADEIFRSYDEHGEYLVTETSVVMAGIHKTELHQYQWSQVKSMWELQKVFKY